MTLYKNAKPQEAGVNRKELLDLIARMIANGHSRKVIARETGLTDGQVDVAIKEIYKVNGVHSKFALAQIVRGKGGFTVLLADSTDRRLLALIASGVRQVDAAAELGVQPMAVCRRLKRLRRRNGVATNVELVAAYNAMTTDGGARVHLPETSPTGGPQPTAGV